MKIIHTADIHLKEYSDVRWKALEEILSVCSEREVDVLTISGDLFDENISGEVLQNKLRELFSNLHFKVKFIPGNHDISAINKGSYFGDDFEVINDYRTPVRIKDFEIWGLPFRENETNEKILNKLEYIKKNKDPEKTNILLFHGELMDSFFSGEDYGDEESGRYMPVRKSDFEKSGLDFVLAGHFHSSFNLFEIDAKTKYIYPGSPVSITKKETGRRKVLLIEDEKYKPIDVKSFYYSRLDYKLDPYSENNPKKDLKKILKVQDPDASLLVNIGGFFNGQKYDITEKELVEFVKQSIDEYDFKYKPEDLNFKFKDISYILESEIYKKFRKILNQENYKNQKEINKIVVKAMSEVEYEN